MGVDNREQLEIKRLQDRSEAETCARMMGSSEPWITLRRDYNASLKLMTNPTKEIYVARANNKIVGFLVLDMNGPFVGYIQSVCVSPELRGKGLGSQLLDFAEKRIFKESPNAFMCVSSFNAGARRLYERCGYKLVGEIKEWIVSGHSEFLLRKTIGPLADFKKQ